MSTTFLRLELRAGGDNEGKSGVLLVPVSEHLIITKEHVQTPGGREYRTRITLGRSHYTVTQDFDTVAAMLEHADVITLTPLAPKEITHNVKNNPMPAP